MNFRSHFEALNDVFWGIRGQHGSVGWIDVAHPDNDSARIYLSNELLYVSNIDRMPKLRPREVDVPIYPKRGP